MTDPEVLRGKPYPDIYMVAAARFPEKPKAKQVTTIDKAKSVKYI